VKMTLVGGLALAGMSCISTASAQTYVAKLHPMNTNITGSQATGQVRFSISGDTLTIEADVAGAPPNIEHWQHFHGFVDNRDAVCPTAAADANHDGVIDLIETGTSSGTTMVPFDTDPAAMDVAHGSYPKASAQGAYHYRQMVSVQALEAAFAKAFHDQKLDLDRRVVFIHGVPADTKLPKSVASLGPIPAQVTLPIACGKIERGD